MALFLKESTDLINTYYYSCIDHHESAAKILFNAINWTKTVPGFTSLSNHDQV